MSAAHRHDLRPFAHSHSFGDEGQAQRERALLWVTLLTLATMAVELLAGWWTGSLALTADGWHMGTHALALGGAVLAYRLSRRAARATRHFAFGGWKIEVLSAYTSALMLAAVALWLVVEAVAVLRAPRAVDFGEALVVAVVGLLVNLASMALLSRGGAQSEDTRHDHHGHAHGHARGHAHGRSHDHNFSAAYLHVLADAMTSVLAIAALAGGYWWGVAWLDPAVALLGVALIGHWSYGMLRNTARALVDATAEPQLEQQIRTLIEGDGDAKLADLHVWQVGSQAWCAALTLVADAPLPAAEYRRRLGAVAQLRHVTVEVHGCPGASPA